MKKIFLLTVLGFFALYSTAQNTEIPIPEFSDQPYVWVKNTNELVKLTNEKADIKTSVSMKMSYTFSGAKSATDIRETDNISILIRATLPMALSSLSLYRLEVKKNKNRCVEIAAGSIGGVNMKDENVISMDSKNVAEGIYELVLSNPLVPGEYVITNGMNSYTFSVLEH
jgi:hypothetical protein